MANIRLREVEGYENFKAEFEFFRCEDEYPGWTGTEKFIIVTDLSEEVVKEKYPKVLAEMKPYLIISNAIGKIRKEENNRERNHQRLAKKYESNFSFDDDTENCHEELVNCKEMELAQLSIDMKEALTTLTDVERRRIVLHYYEGLTGI